MSTPETPAKSQPAGDAAVVDTVVAAPSFEERLRLFWTKNGKVVTALCVVVLLAILAKGGWEYMQAQQEAGIRQDYAAASTSEKLKTFAAAHPGHALAGVAYVRLADEAYAAGKGAEAVTNYEAAVKNLGDSPLTSRARLGLAMAKLQAGQTGDGEAALKQIAGLATEAKGVRLEAAYHLASLAAAAGQAEEMKKQVEQIIQLDATSPWAQRGMMLQAAGQTAPAAAISATPAVAPAAGDATIKLSVPGK